MRYFLRASSHIKEEVDFVLSNSFDGELKANWEDYSFQIPNEKLAEVLQLFALNWAIMFLERDGQYSIWLDDKRWRFRQH